MYIIIIGLGGIGKNLARIAVSEKHNVVVMDTDEERCKDIATRLDLISIHGDATSMPLMVEAGIDRADAVIATTGSDAVNLLVMMQAKEKGVKTYTTIVNEPEHVDIFKKSGVTVMKNPDAIVAEDLYNAMLRPTITAFASLAGGKAEIVEFTIKDDSHAVDMMIKDLGLPEKTLIIAVERGDSVIIPDGNTVIQKGDSLYAFARMDQVNKLNSIFAGSR